MTDETMSAEQRVAQADFLILRNGGESRVVYSAQAVRIANEHAAAAVQRERERWHALCSGGDGEMIGRCERAEAALATVTAERDALKDELAIQREIATDYIGTAGARGQLLERAELERDEATARAERAEMERDENAEMVGTLSDRVEGYETRAEALAKDVERLKALLRECEPEVVDRHGAMHVDMPWAWWERRATALAPAQEHTP